MWTGSLREDEWNETGQQLLDVDPIAFAELIAVAREIVRAYKAPDSAVAGAGSAPKSVSRPVVFPSLKIDESTDALA